MRSSSKSLNVLTQEFYPYRGGIAVYVEETARSAAAAGFEVTVWAPDHEQLRAKSWPFSVKYIPKGSPRNWRCALEFAWTLFVNRVELAQSIVWVPEPGAMLMAMYLNAICCLPARRLVLTVYGSEILRFVSERNWQWRFQKLLNRTDCVGVVSQFTQGLLEKHFQVSQKKLALASGALRHDFPLKRNNRAAKAVGLPIVLLTVARMHPRKGQHHVLEALADVKLKSPMSLEYRIVGKLLNGEYRNKLEALAKNCGIPVHFLDEVSDLDLPTQYAEADIFIMTSEEYCSSVEGFGLVYLEAAAAGLPVIAHRTGGVSEAVSDGVTGLLIEPGDRAGLAAAIRHLTEDAANRTKLGTAGCEHLSTWSWERNVEMLFGRPV